MRFKELLAQAGFGTTGGIKSIAAGAALAWSMQTAQRAATEAAEAALQAEDRYATAVAAFEKVKEEQAELLGNEYGYIASQIRQGHYDDAVRERYNHVIVAEPFDEFAARIAPDGVRPSDVDALPETDG